MVGGERRGAVRVPLGAVAVLRVCAVLRDSADQLAVLGHIMSGIQRDTTAAMRTSIQDRTRDISVSASGGQTEGGGESEAIKERGSDTTLSSDHMTKVQSDRRFTAQMITGLLTELKEEGTFRCLIHTVEEEKRTKAELHHLIICDKEDRLRIKSLQRQLLDISRETTLQTQERDKMAAYLEDQLQEWKMKKRLQEKYVNNSTQTLVYQGQKLNIHMEKQLDTEIEMLKKKLMEEEKAHKELEDFLKNSHASLSEKLEYWMERYNKDTEDKQLELNTLKTNKNNNRAQLQELANKYKDCKQVIIEDRLEKEELRKQMEEERMQKEAAIKIQSWWRGTLVRKGLGPFKKAKKPKKKKGKKAKK